MKFREVLTPDGVKKDITLQESNGTINLNKVTLLKRPEPPKKTENERRDVVIVPATKGDVARPEIRTQESVESGPKSPLGIEFAFRKRTPSKSSKASPTTTPTKATTQSLLALLNIPPTTEVSTKDDVPIELGAEQKKVKPVPETVVVPKATDDKKTNIILNILKSAPKEEESEEVAPTSEPEEIEILGPESEKKLIAMLERALARGVP
jgi:hypothetical protein